MSSIQSDEFQLQDAGANVATITISGLKKMCHLMGVKPKIVGSVALTISTELAQQEILPRSTGASRVEFRDFTRTTYRTLAEHTRAPFELKASLGDSTDSSPATPTTAPAWFMNQLAAIVSIATGQTSLIILCGGTSGTGKTTLASLLATRLCIQNIVSTDSLREAMREALRERSMEGEYEEVFCSTYQTGGCAATQRVMAQIKDRPDAEPFVGFSLHAAAVLPCIVSVIQSFVRKRESAVIEGVHLTADAMERIAHEINIKAFQQGADLPSNDFGPVPPAVVVPTLVHIEKEEGHLQRFGSRGKGVFSQDPNHNKYIAQFGAIRVIQSNLVEATVASQLWHVDARTPEDTRNYFPIFRVLNSNVDRSLMRTHVHSLAVVDAVARIWSGRSDAVQTLKCLTAACLADHFKRVAKRGTLRDGPTSDEDAYDVLAEDPFSPTRVNSNATFASMSAKDTLTSIKEKIALKKDDKRQ